MEGITQPRGEGESLAVSRPDRRSNTQKIGAIFRTAGDFQKLEKQFFLHLWR